MPTLIQLLGKMKAHGSRGRIKTIRSSVLKGNTKVYSVFVIVSLLKQIKHWKLLRKGWNMSQTEHLKYFGHLIGGFPENYINNKLLKQNSSFNKTWLLHMTYLLYVRSNDQLKFVKRTVPGRLHILDLFIRSCISFLDLWRVR